MKIALGICGSIAAYRSVDFVKELTARGHEVRCLLTRGGREFVAAKALETFSSHPVLSDDVFDASHFSTDHIEVARWAETMVIYGASANFLSRAASGAADDFLSLQLLAFEGRVVVAPAMNPSMWNHPAVRRNVALIQGWGYRVIGPVAGRVACGESGVGHLSPHEYIIAALDAGARPKVIEALAGKRVLISAGPMRTALDPVRSVQNRSSGKMGLEIAKACSDAGARVSVLLGPVPAEMRGAFAAFDVVAYEGPADYEAALEKLFPDCDVFFSAAAVLDFDFIGQTKKIERQAFAESTELRMPLRGVPDIVAKFAGRKGPGQRVVAFAAETGSEAEIIERATKKMNAKHADAMIANPVWPGLGPEAERNRVWILRPKLGPVSLGPAPKGDLARPILETLWGP